VKAENQHEEQGREAEDRCRVARRSDVLPYWIPEPSRSGSISPVHTDNKADVDITTNFTGSTSPCDQAFFKLAVTVHRCLNGRAHHCTCQTTASLSPVLTLGGICVLSPVNYLQYLATGSILLRQSCLFSCRPHSLELSAGFHLGPDHHCRLFQTFA